MRNGFRILLVPLVWIYAMFQPGLYAEAQTLDTPSEVTGPLENPSIKGSYSVRSYNTGLSNAGYQSAIVYYPAGAGPFAATTLTAGFTNTKEDIDWLGEHLASHGIITLVFTPTNPYIGNSRVWAAGHIAGIETLKKENLRSSSPLFARVLTDRLGLMGYSMGGAGAVQAANQLGSDVKAVVAFNAYQPVLPETDASYLFVVGNRDTVAIAANVSRVFEAIVSDAPRAFANINGLDHYGVLDRGSKHRETSFLATSWAKNYLTGDTRYMTYINGPEIDQLLDEGKVFAKPSDYIFFDNAQ